MSVGVYEESLRSPNRRPQCSLLRHQPGRTSDVRCRDSYLGRDRALALLGGSFRHPRKAGLSLEDS